MQISGAGCPQWVETGHQMGGWCNVLMVFGEQPMSRDARLSLVAKLKQSEMAEQKTFYANVLVWSEAEFRYDELSIRLDSEAEVEQLRLQANNWPLSKVLRVRSV
jgi:hypothetical protein